jgi:hypothetical protein
LVFGLLHLGRKGFIHCIGDEFDFFLGLWSAIFEKKLFVHGKRTELDLVFGLWSAAFGKKLICSLHGK